MTAFWQKYKEGALMLLVTLFLLLAGIVFQERISVAMEADMEDKLLEITAQIRNTADQKLESGFAVLHAVSAALENGAGEAFLQDQRRRNSFAALGAAKLDGTGIFGPDFAGGDLPLLTEAFRGNDRIAWLRESPFADGDCVFSAVPLFCGDQVVGAVYAVCGKADMPGLASKNIFGGQGASLLVDGEFSTELFGAGDFADGTLFRQGNLEAGERMKRKLYRDRQGVEKFLVNGRETYFACLPLKTIPGWYALTAIPATVVLRKIRSVILAASLVVIGLCCLLLALVWLMERALCENRRKVLSLAYTDRLTGIPNWEGFLRPAEAQPERGRSALAVINIDDFHIANSLLGGESCDRLLRRAAEMLSESVMGGERVCRVEADRFGLLLTDTGEESLRERLTGLMGRIAALVPGLCLTLSAGVVRLNRTPMSLPEALECCVLAEKTGKWERAHRVAFYNEEMMAGQRRNRALVSDFPRALADGELLVYLQPKVRLRDGGIAGAEALARWQHPVYGFLLPEDFVPLLEEAGLAFLLDRYLLRSVCGILQRWRGLGLPMHPVSVHLSRGGLAGAELAEDLWVTVQEVGISPSLIELELSEGMLYIRDEHMAELAERFSEKGFLLAVDDFGAGCAMMGVMPRISAETLRLDRGLLEARGITADFLADAVRIARHLGRPVLAQGIRSREQARALLEAGCELGQGECFARPMPPEGYERLIKSGKVLPE